jgi:4,5-DOPA dioxygenase extradiol
VNAQDLPSQTQPPASGPLMPVLFIGHGSPMNAIEDNIFSQGWRTAAQSLPRPQAILCISAHWETRGTQVTAMAQPRTIHDFGGFPQALFDAQYPAPGSRHLAEETAGLLGAAHVGLDERWGLDHGCWSVLKQMYPAANIPVVQLSLDVNLTGPQHFDLAKGLLPLRQRGVLILASGNLVHNLGRVVIRGTNLSDFNQPYALDWAIQASDLFKQLIDAGDYRRLADYRALGPAAQLAIPTPEHFLPALYALALKGADEPLRYFNDQPVAGSLTMTSLVIGN